MRTVLAIEASNPSAAPPGACVGHVGERTAEVIASSVADGAARSTDAVMVAVDRACRDAGVAPGDLHAIAVSVGPGGYTALRIATTTAKTLAFALGVPVIPVPTALVAARGVLGPDRPALIALAGKKNAAHLTLLHPDGRAEALGVHAADALRPGMARSIVADAHLPQAIAARAAELGMSRVSLALSPQACLFAAVGLEAVGADELAPVYAREPDAVTQWRARHAQPDA